MRPDLPVGIESSKGNRIVDLPATPLLDLIAELERLAKARIAAARTPTDEQRTADQLKQYGVAPLA